LVVLGKFIEYNKLAVEYPDAAVDVDNVLIVPVVFIALELVTEPFTNVYT
jgi:hypothetical protein